MKLGARATFLTTLLLAVPLFAGPEAEPEISLPQRIKNMYHFTRLKSGRVERLQEKFAKNPERTFFAEIEHIVPLISELTDAEIESRVDEEVIFQDYRASRREGSSNRWNLQNDDGLALVPENKASRAILCKDGILLVEGYRRFLSSLYVRAQTLPIRLIVDWSHLSLIEASWKLNPVRPTAEQLLARLRSGYQFRGIAPAEFEALKVRVGEVVFLDANMSAMAQTTFSHESELSKLRVSKLVGRYGALPDPRTGTWRLAHGGGLSLLPLSTHAEAHLCRDGVLVVDGVHKYVTSVYMGARLVPTRIVEVHNVPLRECLKILKDRGIAFLWRLDGTETEEPVPLDALVNDVNRFLVDQMIFEVSAEWFGPVGEFRILERSGAPWPVVVKVNQDIPQLENHMALVLRQAGIIYDASWGTQIPVDVRERSRQVVLAAKHRATFGPLAEALIVEAPVPSTQLDLDAWIRMKLMRLESPCEAGLKVKTPDPVLAK